METKKIIALFDFDGTLIKTNSFPRFLLFYFPLSKFTLRTLSSIPVLLKYALGLIDNNTAKGRIIKFFFKGADREEFMEKVRLFSNIVIPSLIRSEAINRFRWHQERNHRCIVISVLQCRNTLSPGQKAWAL